MRKWSKAWASIVVATGLEAYDPTELDEYGYTRYENVLSSLEFERLTNAGGPTGGDLIRPSDRKAPRIDRLHPVRRILVPQ